MSRQAEPKDRPQVIDYKHLAYNLTSTMRGASLAFSQPDER
jgi:hypothetical protein